MKGEFDDNFHVIVQGVRRFELLNLVRDEPFLAGDVRTIPDFEYDPEDPELEALSRSIKETGQDLITLIPDLPDGAGDLISQIDDPARLLYLVMAHLGVPVEEKVEILKEEDLHDVGRGTPQGAVSAVGPRVQPSP